MTTADELMNALRSRDRARAPQTEAEEPSVYAGVLVQLGRNGLDKISIGDNRIVNARYVSTGGVLLQGQSVLVTRLGNTYNYVARPALERPERRPPLIETPVVVGGNVKWLFQYLGDWWIGGDNNPRIVLPNIGNVSIRNAQIKNLGPGIQDWIIQIAFYTTDGGNPETFSEEIRQYYGPDLADPDLNWVRTFTSVELSQLSRNINTIKVGQFSGVQFSLGPDSKLYPCEGEWFFRGNLGFSRDELYDNQTPSGSLSGSLPGGVASQPVKANDATAQLTTLYDPDTDNSGIDIAALVTSVWVSRTFGVFSTDAIFGYGLDINNQQIGRYIYQSNSDNDPFEWGGLKWGGVSTPFIITKDNQLIYTPSDADSFSSEQYIGGTRTNPATSNTGPFVSVQVENGVGPDLAIESLRNNLSTFSTSIETPISVLGSSGAYPVSTFLGNAYFQDNDRTVGGSQDFKDYLEETKITSTQYMVDTIGVTFEELRLVWRRRYGEHYRQEIEFDPPTIDSEFNLQQAYIFDSSGNSKAISPELEFATDDFNSNYFNPRALLQRGVGSESNTFNGVVCDSLLGNYIDFKVVRVYGKYRNAVSENQLNFPPDRDDIVYDNATQVVQLETWNYNGSIMVKGSPTSVECRGIGVSDTAFIKVWDGSFYDEG